MAVVAAGHLAVIPRPPRFSIKKWDAPHAIHAVLAPPSRPPSFRDSLGHWQSALRYIIKPHVHKNPNAKTILIQLIRRSRGRMVPTDRVDQASASYSIAIEKLQFFWISYRVTTSKANSMHSSLHVWYINYKLISHAWHHDQRTYAYLTRQPASRMQSVITVVFP